jgi:hypothetical protein
MKKSSLLLSLALFCMLLIVPSFALSHGSDSDCPAHHMATSYVGASTTGKFHYTNCTWANKIRSDHRVYFESRDEAIDAGYVPCKVCRP